MLKYPFSMLMQHSFLNRLYTMTILKKYIFGTYLIKSFYKVLYVLTVGIGTKQKNKTISFVFKNLYVSNYSVLEKILKIRVHL
jgi:hypothetical protein